MTQHSFPWNDVNGDRLYDASDFMRFFAAFLKTGVVMSFKDGLRVRSSQNGMNIQVGAGSAVIDGGSYMNDETIAIQINVASSVQDRTDSVVLRMDKNARDTYLYYKPSDTTVVRNDIIFELQLAKISVKMNAAQITDADITDMRSDSTVCGWSTPFDNINVDGIVDQYKEIFEQADVDFQAWFKNLQDQLDDNQAANLQNQINNLELSTVKLTGNQTVEGEKTFTDDTSVNNLEITGNLKRPNKTVLWSGAYFMNSIQTVTPLKKLSECENGWIFHFVRYKEGMTGATKGQFSHYIYLPKEHLELALVDTVFPLTIPGATPKLTQKYMDVFDDHINGNDANNTTDSKTYVLQHILEY